MFSIISLTPKTQVALLGPDKAAKGDAHRSVVHHGSFENLNGEVANSDFSAARIAVFNSVGISAKLPFYGVITSGIPRKPGMTREELIGINAGIVKMVMENCLAHSPNAVFVIVSNPVRIMNK